MPKEAFDVCNWIRVPSDCWNEWKAKNLVTLRKGGKDNVVFSSPAAIEHFKKAKNGRATRVDDQNCILRYCTKDKMDIDGACQAGDSLPNGRRIEFAYAGQYIGCYVGTANVVSYGKYAGMDAWRELDSYKPGEAGEPTDSMIDFACGVWDLDPKKVKGSL